MMTNDKIRLPRQDLIFPMSIACFAIYVLASAFLVSILFANEVVDKIVIVVNDESVTKAEMEEAMAPVMQQIEASYGNKGLQEKISEVRKEAIERIIEDKLFIQEAKKQNIQVSNDEIEQKLAETRSKFPGKESFEKTLASKGLTIWALKKTYKEQIMVRKLIRQYVRGHINITPTQIMQYYKGHQAEFQLPEAVDISQILIRYKSEEESARAEKTALQIKDIVSSGADFASVAKKFSEGPNIEEGGGIGLVERGVMAKEIDDVIFNAKPGELVGPIKTAKGFVVVKINSARPSQAQPIEQVKGRIEDILIDQNAKSVIDKWTDELKSKAYISIKDE